MNARLPTPPTEWVDPDDAPELTEEWFATATPSIGGRVVSRVEFDAAVKPLLRGRPPSEVKRPMVSMRMDPDLVAHLRASGKGWQTKVNAALRTLVEQGRL